MLSLLALGDGLKRDSAIVSGAADRTIMVYFRLSSVPTGGDYRTYMAWVKDAAGAYNQWDGAYSSADTNAFSVGWNNGTTGNDVAQPFTPSLNRWYQLVVARRSSLNTHRYYIDGREVGLRVLDMSASTLDTLRLGFDEYSNDAGMDLARFREWSALLTPNEIKDEMGHATAVRTANLIADCPLLSDALDVSGNGNHFTVMGSPSYFATPTLAVRPSPFYIRHWTNGIPTEIDDAYLYERTGEPSGGADPIDGTYPEIIAGEGKMTLTGSGGPHGDGFWDLGLAFPSADYSTGGFWTEFGSDYPGSEFHDLTKGRAVVYWRPITRFWEEVILGGVTGPLMHLSTRGGSVQSGIQLTFDADETGGVPDDVMVDLRTHRWNNTTISSVGSAAVSIGSRAELENEWQKFEIEWQCGTVTAVAVDTGTGHEVETIANGVGSVTDDGWIRVYHKNLGTGAPRTLIYDLTGLRLLVYRGTDGAASFLGAQPINSQMSFWCGYYGMFGQLSHVEFYDDLNESEDVEPEEVDEHPFTLPDAQGGLVGPLVKVRIYNPYLDTEYVASTQWIQDPIDYWGGFAEASLLRIDDMVYATSDRSGPPQITALSFEMSDVPDGNTATPRIRTWLGQIGARQLRRCEIWVQMITDTGRRALLEPLTVFRGYIEEYEGLDDFRMSFSCLCWINRFKDRPVLPHKIGDIIPATTIPEARDRRVPLALGSLTDEGSAEDPPVFIQDETGRGSNGGASGSSSFNPDEPFNTFGNVIGAPPAPTGLAMVEDFGAGTLQLAGPDGLAHGSAWQNQWCFQVTRIRAGMPQSDPFPFDPGDEFLTLTANDSAITATCADDGDPGDIYRFYIGTSPVGGAGGRPTMTHYIDTTDPVTGVQFTDKEMSSGGVLATNTRYWCAALWVADDGRTEPSIIHITLPIPFIMSPGYNRPIRFAFVPPSVAVTNGEFYIATYPNKDHLFQKFNIDVTNLNTDLNVLWEWDHVTPGTAVEGITQPVGVIPPIYLGLGVIPDNEGFLGWGAFLLSGRPCKEFISSYIVGSEVFGTGRLDEGFYNTLIAAPGKGQWNTRFGPDEFITVNIDGEEHRLYMMFILNSPLLDTVVGADAAGNAVTQSDFRVNIRGMDDAKDGSGAVITSGYEQLPILLRQLLIADTPSMAEPFDQDPQFRDGTSKVDDFSFSHAQDDAAVAVPSGPAAARWIATGITVQELLTEWAVSMRARVYTDEFGQFGVCVTNPNGDPEYDIVEAKEVIKKTFRFRDSIQGYGHRVPFRYNPRYSLDGSEELVDADEVSSPSAITESDEDITLSEHLLSWRRGLSTSRQVARSILRESEQMPRDVSLDSVLHFLTRAPLGRRVSITHSEGPQAGGWTNQIVQVLGKRLSPQALTVGLTCLDLRRQVGELTWLDFEGFMPTSWGGGSRIDSLLNDGTYDVFPNWIYLTYDWDAIPSTHGLRLRATLATDAGTVRAAVYASTDLATVVAQTATHNTSTLTEVAVVDIPRPVGDGEVRYMIRPILAGGAVIADARGIVAIEGYEL
jgi:hypothetical protein